MYLVLSVLVSRRQTYCTGHSSGMGLSEFSVRDGPGRESVGDGSVGATDISKFRCPGSNGSKSSARLAPAWFWSRLSTSEYPSAECKSVEFHPCESRVGNLAVMCDADTYSFLAIHFSDALVISVVNLFRWYRIGLISFFIFRG